MTGKDKIKCMNRRGEVNHSRTHLTACLQFPHQQKGGNHLVGCYRYQQNATLDTLSPVLGPRRTWEMTAHEGRLVAGVIQAITSRSYTACWPWATGLGEGIVAPERGERAGTL